MAKIGKIQQELNAIIAEEKAFFEKSIEGGKDPANADLHWLHDKARELQRRIKKFRRYREVQSLGFLRIHEQAFKEFESALAQILRGFESGDPINWDQIDHISTKYMKDHEQISKD